MAFRTKIRVRFADVDLAGIVYYPRLFHFCHVAMEDYFREVVGRPYPEVVGAERLGYPAVHIEADFRRPLSYGDEIEIEVAISAVGATSLTWSFAFHRDGEAEPLARVEVVTAGIDLDRFAGRPVPDWIRSAGRGS